MGTTGNDFKLFIEKIIHELFEGKYFAGDTEKEHYTESSAIFFLCNVSAFATGVIEKTLTYFANLFKFSTSEFFWKDLTFLEIS